jgi:DNA-binding transcriptional ArsR family regulator
MPSSADTTPQLVVWLRAAGETTRLRLLALCAERDLSVSDLASAIRQSEPRVSRHLKIMSEAGLIERLRQGQWVHYQATREGAAAGFVQGVLAQLDRSEPVFVRDRESLHAAGDAAPQAAVADTRLGRALRAFMETGGAIGVVGSALVIGAEHPELLAMAADISRQCTAIAQSRRSAQAMRAFAERAGLNCRVLLGTEPTISQRDTTRAGAPFDAIVFDRVAATGSELSQALSVARQALAPAGRLWLFERYEALENARGRVVEHPIGRIRRLFREAGFDCERLSPIEADGQHVLAAAAVTTEKSDARVA